MSQHALIALVPACVHEVKLLRQVLCMVINWWSLLISQCIKLAQVIATLVQFLVFTSPRLMMSISHIYWSG